MKQSEEIKAMQKVIKYKNEKAYVRGVERMTSRGYRVVSVSNPAAKYGCLKTGCLGLLFLPLALLGRKPQQYVVLYEYVGDLL